MKSIVLSAESATKVAATAMQDQIIALSRALQQSVDDNKAFINQMDREGLGMKTLTDHRKRVEKFLKQMEGKI